MPDESLIRRLRLLHSLLGDREHSRTGRCAMGRLCPGVEPRALLASACRGVGRPVERASVDPGRPGLTTRRSRDQPPCYLAAIARSARSVASSTGWALVAEHDLHCDFDGQTPERALLSVVGSA